MKRAAGPWELSVFGQGTRMRSTGFFGNGCWRWGGDSRLFPINLGGRVPGTDGRRLGPFFRFQIGIKNFETPNDQRNTMDLFRSIANNWTQFNVTTYHEYWAYADQYEMIKPTMLRDNITAIITMLIIAFILIPNLLCGFFITVAMITINVGVYGFMSLWSINLDGVSMITLIMAIGFAVDLSAHISYAYVCSIGTPTQRTIAALEQLGWPVFQGALSTILGVMVLATVDSYMIQTFFKTVFLVILFGLLHSVVFLPVSLALLLPERKIEWCCKNDTTKCQEQSSIQSTTGNRE
uniref:SSD domain-containing protein n=1 Tax=Romanomermis culicivorax TaxID=13658 RepID=A0A915HUA3_ROMCU